MNVQSLGYITLDYFSPLTALGLFALLGGIIVLLGFRSMAGMGPVRKWVAIGVRLAVVLLIILILGNIQWIRQNTDVEVMIVRDISRSTQLVRDFPGRFLQSAIDDYVVQASAKSSPSHESGDKVGQISFNEHAFIDAIPSDRLSLDARAIRGPGTGTDAAGALQLALASMGNDAMHRLLLIWDGNATTGDLNAALAAASSQHVPVDVMPLHYNVEHEVMMDKFIAPTWRQEGQPFNIEVHLLSTNSQDVTGNLSITHNGTLLPLKNGQTTEQILIRPGKNVERIEIPPQEPGVHEFHATIEGVANVSATADSAPPASQLDNKSADIFTFVQGKGKVLLVDNIDPDHQTDAARFLRQALQDEQINVSSITPDEFPNDAIELQGYDAIVLANVPRGVGGLSEEQERMVASYVHDTGGGLVMIGGPNTFGAGGWQGSRLEQELPVTMEVPAQRQIPKGALVLCMDPAEAPDGNYWGEQCAIKAAEALSSQDEIGVISFSWNFRDGANTGCTWDCPLGPKGDGSKVLNAIKNWQLGDLPSFEDAVTLALNGPNGHGGLIDSDARSKHIIIITDDDPQLPSAETVQRCKDNKISISTVTIYPHMSGNVAPGIRELAKDTGGKSYGPIENNPNQLPQIFIKEASVVKRSVIQEDPKGIPVSYVPSSSEIVKGLAPGAMPPVFGLDTTGRRDNPLIDVPMTAGSHHDPLLATWQAGLGKVAVFMGDATNRWDANWVRSDIYSKFWSQMVRGVSRSPMSPDFDVDMTTDGNNGHLTVTAVNQANGFNNFLSIGGTIACGADLTSHPIRLMPTGPGTYEADFDASQQGSYICYLHYSGQNNQSGSLLAGTVVNSSPELRDLQSNDGVLKDIAQRTGGRLLTAFDPASADLFSRDGLEPTRSPRPIWDILIPPLLALILIDVAVRRIAWDWLATKKMAAAAAAYVRSFTMTYRKVESPQTLQSLKRVREEVAEREFKPAAKVPQAVEAAPDPSAKFDAGAHGVEGDITAVVGGALDKPIPSAPSKIQPKGLGEHTSGLLAAKRRAQQKIRQQGEEP